MLGSSRHTVLSKARILFKEQLWMKVITGLLLGGFIGLLLGPAFGYAIPHVINGALTALDPSWVLPPEVLSIQIGHWLALPGYIFLGVLQMVVIPLIFSSVIRGIADSKNPESVKRVGLRVLGYFVLTTLVAITIGLTLAKTIQPGEYMDKIALKETITAGSKYIPPLVSDSENLPKEITTILPKNIIKSMSEGDMLKIVIFAAFFGLALLSMPRSTARPLIDLAISLQDACMIIVGWVLKLAPLAVFGLIAEVTAQVGTDALLGMAAYMGTVILGLFCVLGFYMLIIKFIVRRPVGAFLRTIREAQLVAFSTSSSAATMPVTMRIAKDELGLRPAVPQLVVPLGTTINMDGTAVYQTIAAVFLAQVTGIEISLSGYLLIIMTALGASIGAPGMPGVGVVILSTILHGIGVDAGYIALIIGVDRILDMCRTTINVTGDLVASAVMDKLLGTSLQDELSDAFNDIVDEVKGVVK